MLTSLDQAEKKSIKPLARVVSWASVGVDPSLMGLGPIGAVREAIKKAKWNLDEVDLFEINEAFAVVPMATMSELNIHHSKVNIRGGACALGHPIGASGARIVVTPVHAMIRERCSKGIASICIGGGEAMAIAIELSD